MGTATKDAMARCLEDFGLGEEQMRRLQEYVHQLESARFNVTGYQGADIWLKGIWDSLCAAPPEPVTTGLDIGSGGGFPGVPLAIAHPEMHWTLLDARQKRGKFLEDVQHALGLTNVTVVVARAEELAHEASEPRYGAVLARAIGAVRLAAELEVPLTIVGGWTGFMRGPAGKAEVEAELPWIESLGGSWDRVVDYQLPQDAGSRALVWVRKVRPTPEAYPRVGGLLGR